MKGEKVKLGQAYWLQEGPGVRKWQFTTSGVKLLNVANILKTGVIDLTKTDRHLSEEEVSKKYSHFLADEGDLVIASSGISIDDDGFLRTRGAFIEESHLPLCMNTSTIRFKGVDGVSDLRFLKHWLQSFEFRSQISREVTGIAQKNFGPSHLNRIWIHLPPLSEQKRIAEILDKADALRAQRRESIAKLDELLQATFLDMFGDPVTNPKGWAVGRLSNVVARLDGGKNLAPSETETKYRVLKVSAVTYGVYRPEESKYLPSDFRVPNSYIVRKGDLLISRANTAELIGATAFVWETPENIVLPDKIWKFIWRSNVRIEPLFIFHLSKDPGFRRVLGRRATGTSGSMKNIAKPKLLSLTVPVPPFELQRRFSSIVVSIEGQKARLRSSLAELDTLFASLQSRAFNGGL